MNFDTQTLANIPVLTDVIAREDEKEISPIVSTITEPQPELLPELATDLSTALTTEPDHTLEELGNKVRAQVLNQLLTRIDFVLEHRVRDSLADVLQTAVEDLAKEIRQGLCNSLEEVIHRAVTQEISKLQSSKTLMQ